MAGEPGKRTKVLVVEDHAALGEALLFALGFEPDIEAVGLAPTVAAAVEMAAASQPDVVLMDVRLPDGNGIEATPRVLEAHPGAAVVVLTAHADPVFALRAAEAGASGFVPKDVRIARIVGAARAVRAGEVAVGPTLLRSLLAQASAEADSAADMAGVTPEQLAVLDLLRQGLGSDGIAGELGVDAAEAETAVAGVLLALDARSPLEALVVAARQGLLKPSRG